MPGEDLADAIVIFEELTSFASPGRFFASTELKSLLANFVYIYDMKMEKEGVVPPPTWFMINIVPNQTAEVMFRKRQN